MICIIALIVFAILALFSARYRPLAAEAFDCVFRRVTFRKCHSGLDKRLKGQITGKLMKRSKRAGRFVYKYFEVFSWAFLIILILSLVQIGISVYNFAAYGNCNGPDETGFCIFDPLGTAQHGEASLCTAPIGATHPLLSPDVAQLADNPQRGNEDAAVTLIEFGCFACPNTAKQAPAIEKILGRYGPDQLRFIYVDFPLDHPFAPEASLYARCVLQQDETLYWQYHFLLFEQQTQFSEEQFMLWAEELGLDKEQLISCVTDPAMQEQLATETALAETSGVYGTPTFFVNGEPHVGVIGYKLLKGKIDEALKHS